MNRPFSSTNQPGLVRQAGLSPWIILLGAVLLVAATALVYSPVFHALFLWDDEFLVQRNPFIRSPILGLEVFRHFLFEEAKGEFYRPVQNLSYMIDYARAGLDASAFHLSNVIIHCLNGILVFLLARRLMKTLGSASSRTFDYLAFLIAATWLLHPVHSAIVAYVSGRADSLALLGLLAGWLCWEHSVMAQGPTTRYAGFILAALLTVAACCSKEIALAGLAFFCVYLWVLRIDLPVVLKTKASFGLLAIFICYLSLRHLPVPNLAPVPADVATESEKGGLFLRAMGDYARLFIYPNKLFMERQVGIPTGLFTDPIKNDPLFPHLAWVGGAALLLMLTTLFWDGKSRRLRWLGAIWFAVMILPVSNLFPLNATVAEHWLYIPSIGLCLWLSGCWMDCSKSIRRISTIIAPLLFVLLGWRANQRAQDWRDPLTFYRATIRDGGDSVRIRMNLAGEYQKISQLDEADQIYRSILKAIPSYSLAKISLAQNLVWQKRGAEAANLLANNQSKAASTAENLAVLNLLKTTRSVTEAAAVARKAYENHPSSWPAAQALSRIYRDQAQPSASLKLVEGFAARNWWCADALNELGELYLSQSHPLAAIASYQAAARLDIRNAEPINQAALIIAQNGNYDAAISLQKLAIARDGGGRQREILAAIKKLQAAR